MRRKKKLILNIIKILAVVLIAVGLFFIFRPKKKVNTTNETQNGKELIKVTPFNESNKKIELPEIIKDASSNEVISKDEKTYTPLTKTSETFLIPIRSNNEITILIGDDSSNLLTTDSPVQVGKEYSVSGIEENIETVHYFTVDGYDYPIFLLLGESGKLYYVDIEKSYTTGLFAINGHIENISEVQNIYQAEATEKSKTYKTAIICCSNGEGYEFNTDMIGR